MPEILVGTPEPDTLTATMAAFIDGLGGNDTLTGSAQGDIILGQAGNDSLVGGDGNDVIVGGSGADTVNTGGGNDVVLGGPGNDNIGGMAGSDTVLAGSGDDIIAWNDPIGDLVFGNQGNDTIIGGDVSADTSFGGEGDDLVQAFTTTPEAATAPDFLSGDDGNDVILGGAGDDTIQGGTGNDTMSGDGGNNTFLFNLATATGKDLITDFNPAGDVVLLANVGLDFDPIAHLTDGPSGAVLDLGDGSTVTFLGHTASEFKEADFVLA
jgi:Ca2+-binding RTX toxin-like protein